MITYGEYFKRRSQGETVKSIADSMGKQTKAINRALERVGYKANGSEWVWKGEGAEPLNQELFFGRITTQKQSASIEKAKAIKEKTSASKEIASTIETKASNSKVKAKASESEPDAIDMLLSKQANSKKRAYRGFYFDDDVLSVIDGIATGNKSDLVNEALRKVFKEKGLL